MSTREKILLVNKNHKQLSINRQCELLDMPRSMYYYEPAEENALNLLLMNEIDELYTKYPFYGSPRICASLNRLGYEINIKRIKRLMAKMGITAIYPGPNLSKRNMEHKVYPYLLRGLQIKNPNHVWSADITYIRMNKGFMYLMAIIDWYSRYVIAWELSNTLDGAFCREALIRALKAGSPDIFNTDQGVQFTEKVFTGILDGNGIQISMDSVGRATDNVFVERLWRSLKYEDIYIKGYETVKDLLVGLEVYFDFFNNERPHQSLGYKTPSEIYFSKTLN